MSVEHPRAVEQTRNQPADRRGEHIGQVAARVSEWLSGPAEDPPARSDALDEKPRHRDVVNPSATRIGYTEDPKDDLAPRVRALHEERRAELQGNSERLQQLDVLRITQALCNSLDLSVWERDRVLGVVAELDPTEFGGHRTIPRVALVVARRVVDAERRAWLGFDSEVFALDDPAGCAEQPPERLDRLAERLHELADSDEYVRLLSECDLAPAAADRLEATLERELGDHLGDAAFGRCPRRDPALPAFEHAAGGNRNA